VVTAACVLCLSLTCGAAFAKNPVAKQAKEELEFGYKAAKRGYWQEALERFELANELTPNQPRILNNFAVALEANGRFDEARSIYESALVLDRSNTALKKNFARFQEFYTTFVADPNEDPDAVEEKETVTEPEADAASATDTTTDSGREAGHDE
jgi:tetratricopeptide (TPR) repeat protein